MNELAKSIERLPTETTDKDKWQPDIEKLPLYDYSVGELKEGKTGELTLEAKEFKTLDEVLDQTSEEEKNIYNEANLEKGEINGREVLQRTDINYDAVNSLGQSNLERMQKGMPPIVEGKPIELHHIGQKSDSPLAELTIEEHRGPGNDGILHDKTVESDIDRQEFKKERENHWKERAAKILEERGNE